MSCDAVLTLQSLATETRGYGANRANPLCSNAKLKTDHALAPAPADS